jgi:hydrogenase expression/formation protein HypE
MMPDKSKYPECPIPKSEYPRILLAHGGGGRLMHHLIEKIFAAAFENPELETSHDSALINVSTKRLALTTDSYVVQPIFFPGGDIGRLAVYGTVNDLAMSGARPLYLSAGFILEEGLEIEELWRICLAMRKAADETGVKIITGDTKVVDHDKCDRLFINTAGVGVIEHDLEIKPQSIKEGDAIILNGDVGRHGIAVMARREGLSFESEIESDCAPLADAVLKMLEAGIEIHCLRDLTRGGLATNLVEIAKTASCQIEIDENQIAVHENVRGACELLGFDPIYVPNEGRFVTFLPEKDAENAMKIIKSENPDFAPAIIGSVSKADSGLVIMKNRLGTSRIIDMLSGEQLPRIC